MISATRIVHRILQRTPPEFAHRAALSQAEEHEALVEACANVPTHEHWMKWNGLYEADRKAIVRAVLAVIAEKAKEWPTEGMTKQFLEYYTLTADDSCAYQAKDVFIAMLAASPLVRRQTP